MRPETQVTVTASKTLTDADSGIVQYVAPVAADPVIVTLPAAAAGKVVTVVNGGRRAGGPVGSGAAKSLDLTVRPAGSDTMTGLGFTPAAAKGALSAKTVHTAGDRLELVAGAATWYVRRATGTWTREA